MSRKLFVKLALAAGILMAAVSPASADHTQSCRDWHVWVNPKFATGDRNESCTNWDDEGVHHCYVWVDYGGWQFCARH